MKFFIAVFGIVINSLLCLPGFAQTTLYYLEDQDTECDKLSASYYKVVTTTDSSVANIKTYTVKDKLVSDSNFSDLKKQKQDGISKSWFENGQLSFEGNFKEGKREGILRTYYSDGKLKRDDSYRNDELITGKCFAYTGADTTYFAYEIPPEFPNGINEMMRFLARNIRYPKVARRKGMDGLVVVSFTVNKEGRIQDTRVLKSVHPLFDNEVIRVVYAMPQWRPGFHDGKKVKVRYNLPVRFNLEG